MRFSELLLDYWPAKKNYLYISAFLDPVLVKKLLKEPQSGGERDGWLDAVRLDS